MVCRSLGANPDDLKDPIKISIPRYVLCGQGKDEHYEFEIKITVLDETWTVFRRYSRFREMHKTLKLKYPELLCSLKRIFSFELVSSDADSSFNVFQLATLEFPPKKLFGNKDERVIAERRSHLEHSVVFKHTDRISGRVFIMKQLSYAALGVVELGLLLGLQWQLKGRGSRGIMGVVEQILLSFFGPTDAFSCILLVRHSNSARGICNRALPWQSLNNDGRLDFDLLASGTGPRETVCVWVLPRTMNRSALWLHLETGTLQSGCIVMLWSSPDEEAGLDMARGRVPAGDLTKASWTFGTAH
ncbi:hypothetical protein BTVI_122997 [Pitangus sulphuratus]|nr:hypothetical protein BTVI_122997 [Pitangus sulphuratus]